MTISDKLANVATVIVALCAVAVAGSTFSRHGSADRPGGAEGEDTVRVANWADLQKHGQLLGQASAPITVVELGDYECPYCAEAAPVLDAFVKNHASQVKLIYRHWPLKGHKFSRQAAQAGECAAEQGRFWAMHRELFAGQDSIGVRPFSRFARMAGIPDSVEYGACIARHDTLAAISLGSADASRAGATGTPTLVVNGLRLRAGSDTVLLHDVVVGLLRRHAE